MNKKILAATLVFVMMLSAFTTVFAAVTPTANIAKIGTKEYATLAEAIADVPTDGTLTTITILRDVLDGAGIETKVKKGDTGKNFVIDFAGHTYGIEGPWVGSTGTESQAFHLERGVNITLKNGTLTTESAPMMIQNYCNLTLENMNINNNNPKSGYAMSNNCGNVKIIGNTSISSGKFAFDLYWWPTNTYEEGVQVEVNTTGTIKGDIELGTDGTPNTKNKLTIKNINHIGKIVEDPKLANDKIVTIEGGTFSEPVPEKYLAAGKVCKKIGNSYKVGTDNKINLEAINGKIESSLANAFKGETITITPNGNVGFALKGITVVDKNGNNVEVKDNKFTMPDTEVTVKAEWTKLNNIIVEAANANVKVAKQAVKDEVVTLEATANAGYVLKGITVVDANGKAVEVKDNKFTMPDAEVTVKVEVAKLNNIKVEAANANVKVVKQAVKGEVVSLEATANAGYVLKGITVVDANGKAVEVKNNKFTMPDAEVTVKVEVAKLNKVILKAINGEVTASIVDAVEGEVVTITATGKQGYEFKDLTVVDANGNKVEVKDNKFVMPNSDVTVNAEWLKLNKIVIEKSENGTVTASVELSVKDKVITLTSAAKEGFTLKGLTVVDANGNKVEVKDNKFVMPDGDVKVTAEWEAIKSAAPEIDLQAPVEEVETGVKDKEVVQETVIESFQEEIKTNPELAEKVANKKVSVDVEIDSKKEPENIVPEVKKNIEDTAKKIEEEVKGEVKVLKFFDIKVAVKADGETVDTIDELKKPIELVVALPEELQEVKEGYKRIYYIIREHEGKTTALPTKLSEDGTNLTFASDKFSTYALAYTDVLEEQPNVKPEENNSIENPKTGDNIVLYMATLVISVVGLGALVAIKNKKSNAKH